VISENDEAALSWFFGPGLAIYERSTFGAILAKLVRESATSEKCLKCDGAGIIGGVGGFAITNVCEGCEGSGKAPNGRTLCPTCSGFGTAAAPRRKAAQQGGWCPACLGTGSTAVEERKRRRTPCQACCVPYDATGRRRKREQRAGCRNCLGTGEEPISVKPIQAAQDSGGAMQSDDGALVRFAITSRRVAKVRELSPVLAEALAAYYGDEGQRCALGEPSGRLYALRRLTAEGRRNPHSNDATEQAAALYGRAAKAWNRQAKGKRQLDREKAKLQQLAGSLTRLGYLDLGSAVGKIVTT
jgi:hypothetical protein